MKMAQKMISSTKKRKTLQKTKNRDGAGKIGGVLIDTITVVETRDEFPGPVYSHFARS